ncbi:hypothetical protein H310_01120 [Aphanomyces invadans]|uniref:Uncharacterized protein n=1 Tax=Aphanomyces invadans TaxID=157072 RepID=A0A024USD6_9STRA|nr:hypothetical protein H310_01120 [Aphanomyces invadans]ETW08568.1 hypothetical protein H310_01120 [Aphanomyces invadans]|eukprot:XP_008862373.1 hypothetical protein H310_01120 [Aphanomyces invadans]
MLQPKRPKKKCIKLELPSITLYEPVLSVKQTRHHVPLDEVPNLAPSDIVRSPSKPRSPLRPVDKVAMALGSKAAHLAHRVIIRPIFEERKELQAEVARQILEQRMLDEDEIDDSMPTQDQVLHQSHDIFHARVLLPLEEDEVQASPAAVVAPLAVSPTPPNQTRLNSPPVDTTFTSASPSSTSLRGTTSLTSFASPPATKLKGQKSAASFADPAEERILNRRRSDRELPRSVENTQDHSHMIFMVPEKVLTMTKRASLPSSTSIASFRRPLQKLLLALPRMIQNDAGVDVDCTISIHLLSSGDVTIAVSEKISTILLAAHATGTIPFEPKGLTLSAPDAAVYFADEELEVYSPMWTTTLASHVGVEHNQVVLLPPPSRHVVLSMQQDVAPDVSPHAVRVQAVAVQNGLSLRVSPDPASSELNLPAMPLHIHVNEHELARVILRMDNMHVASDHVAQLTLQKAWCAMFLHDMHALVELALQRHQSSPPPFVPEAAVDAPSISSEELSTEAVVPPPSAMSAADSGFASDELNDVCRIAKSMAEIVMANTVLWIQKQEAALLYSRTYVKSFSRRPGATNVVLASYQAKEHERRAILLILDDMLVQFLHYECRVELHVAKASGGYNDIIATRIQSAFRMCIERRKYTLHQRVRNSAAKLIQTLQRGISARKRYIERKLERERYLYFGFRSTLVAQSKWDNPTTRLAQRTAAIEARRVTFLMGVVTGAFLFHKPVTTAVTMLPVDDVVSLLNQHGMVVGCPSNLGSLVADAFQHAYGCHHSSTEVVSVASVQTALVAVLRGLKSDTFGQPLRSHRANPLASPPSAVHVAQGVSRWLLKSTPPLHTANLANVLTRREAAITSGRQSAHLIAYHFRVAVLRPMAFEKCRDEWNKDMEARYEEGCRLAQFSVDELVCWGMEKLQEAVKVWGWDPDPMFEVFNVCLTHRLGKAALRQVEAKFNEFATAMNNHAKKVEIHSLRDEINEELQGFEKLLAWRCLNAANDDHVTPASDLLHVLLREHSTTDHLRMALPTVLPVATYLEKAEIATRLLTYYANDQYGHAVVLLLWSCLDAAENATLEAGQLLEKLAKSPGVGQLSGLARALELLTGSHLFRLLEFCVKVCPLNERVRDAIRTHMAPYVSEEDATSVRRIKMEAHRICLAMCNLPDSPERRRLVASRFGRTEMQSATEFWTAYERLFGEMDQGYAQVSMESVPLATL